MLPWQFANIQALDITVQQIALEGNILCDFLLGPTGWHPQRRHDGYFVAPDLGLEDSPEGVRSSRGFTLLPAQTTTTTNITPLRNALAHLHLPPHPSAMHITRARPLTHLTLRIPAKNWWTWTDSPLNTCTTMQLALDPSLGNGTSHATNRPTSIRMTSLAALRRNGQHPSSQSATATAAGWSHIIAQLPDLKTLELVLESFKEKKGQLDHVVECAKTWRFGIAGTGTELRWDGVVGMWRWNEVSEVSGVEANYRRGRRVLPWYVKSREFEGRRVRFVRGGG